ncbi:hypothetical protein BJV82DRAFT_673294 [Fennellomyces sp. T-0311]|nr:hypothetical protein BJV82DRAFT_673294 [Fennellomyces sp. T-0311]
MSSTESSDSATGSTTLTSISNTLHIPGYHFKTDVTIGQTHGGSVYVYGYRISDRLPIVAKVSTNNLRSEREFYMSKKLYQYIEGASFLVQPLKHANLPSGLAVSIYADEGPNATPFARKQNTFDLGTFLRFAIQCTSCLDFIHKHGAIHGEIRLSSFQWNGSDNDPVKLWNFGAGLKSFETYLTSDGWRKTARNKEFMGMLQNLLAYMSPEQTGRTTYAPDHRTDLYSLGVVFFVLLSGRAPFDGGPLEILNSILSKRIPLVHEIQLDVPEVLSRIIEKMLHKAPDDRYASARGIRADLNECLTRLQTARASHTEEAIPLFPLAQHDVASVFTLPKAIYGRQDVIAEMKRVIEHAASVYRPARMQSRFDVTLQKHSSVDDISVASDSSSNYVHAEDRSHSSHRVDTSDASSISSRMYTGNISKPGAMIVGLYGPAGTGKSTLYSAVQPIARKQGYVAVAKFDSRNKVPYATVLRSLSQVLQQILSESEEEITQFYDHVKICLNAQFSNIALLTDFVPELRPLLLSTDTCTGLNQAVQMDNIEAKLRFHKVFVEVFRAVTHWRMTSLFLDDLHQADDPSLELIEALIMSRVHMLMFVSYRDQEMTTKLVELLESKIANVQFIKVEPLSMDSLTDFISDALHRPRDTNYKSELLPFASVVYRKTQGNAFFTAQLLQTLERKKLIYFNWEKNYWDYDLREVEDATLFGNSRQLDASFMVARLRELPRAGQSLLKWASFVGDTFSWKMIKDLMIQMKTQERPSHWRSLSANDEEWQRPQTLRNKSAPSTATLSSDDGSDYDPVSGLQAVLQEGYIMAIDGDEFRWCHDRISQAAGELADPETRDRIHLTIAQYLMQEKTVDSFLVADHLLKCHSLVMTLKDKGPYRQVMIEAGSKGQAAGAHVMAFAYYKSAIQLGNRDDEWNDASYDATLKLYSNAVALSYVVGDNERTLDLLEILFKNTKRPIDRMPAFHIQAKYYFNCQMHVQGVETMFRCLDELGGERARMDISDEALARDYRCVEDLVQGLGADGILELPTCDDVILTAAMGVMDELLALSYFTGQKREMYYWASRILYLSFTKGPTSVTGSACMIAGLGYAYLCNKHTFAERLGRIGISVADKHANHQDRGRAYSLYPAFVLLWNNHHRESVHYFRTGIQYSLAGGDRMYAAFHQMHMCIVKFTQGYPISDVIQETSAAYQDIHAWSPTIDHNSFVMCILRAAKALQGQTYIDTPQVFDGDDGFNDANFLEESSKYNSNPDLVLNWYESYKMVPLTLYGHLDAAIQAGYRCVKTIEGHPSHRHTRMMLFFFSLALLDKARQDPCIREANLMQVKENQKLIMDWAAHSRINYIMYWTMIEAELTAFGESPDIVKAIRLYEEAIDQAREGGWYMELCVMHEYTGAFYKRARLDNVAYGFITKAIELYTCHGSYGKVRHLKAKYTALLVAYDDSRQDYHETGVQTDPLPINHEHRWASSASSSGCESSIGNEAGNQGDMILPITTEQALMTLDILDMASILKSSHVLASEVKFQGLLKSMMNIILENSAADCGAIVIKDEKYGVCAYGSQEQASATTYDPPRPLSENDELLSSRIIHHTIHTGERILIHDVNQDTRFAVGPWFDRTGSKSVICMPIIHKITTVGCLFIEGPVGIFTQRHITVLSLLCQQMGISITNAFLFKSVQRVTMANMRMIEMQKQALEEARKSKEAADRATRLREIFLANMSHEIRTPFSGFYGMISLLSETNLDPEQRDLVQTAKESCEMLLQLIDDLLNFSKLQAGKVSLDLSPVVLDDTIADVVEILIAMAIQKRINITYTIDPDVPSVVVTDANRLRQVIINLLGNAIKFTQTGTITIRCSLDQRSRRVDEETIPLLIEVIDTGIGISEDQRKVLFVPFSQVDGSTTRKYGGTGLGLSICLQLVRLMSGTIDVSSTPNEGSNFYFTIQTSQAAEKAEKREKITDELLQYLRKTRILVADKHISTVTMVRKLLPGIQVDGVCTVNELLLQQAKDYPIIIVGLFLTHDPEFEEWADHLHRFLELAQCIVVMHYPTGAVGDLLGKNRLTVDIDSNAVFNSRSLQSNPSRAIVRMAVPLRRISLLRTLADMLSQSSKCDPETPRPSMAARHSSDRGTTTTTNKFFTDDEHERLQTMHILAAEGIYIYNPIAQKLLYKQLTKLGLKVVCANNGLEAVEAWTRHPPGHFKMAFFDHHMPKCDGVEATKRIRAIEREHKTDRFTIIALTADIQDSARETCMNAGMDGYLTKPMSQKVLAEALRSYCLS